MRLENGNDALCDRLSLGEENLDSAEVSASQSLWFRVSTNSLLFCALAVLFGLFDALYLIGWNQIDPANVAWLKGDPAVYQAGWEFLRRQPWAFPPTWLARLDYPFGTSAAYLDIIPLVAVPLHLISNLLPKNFQYFGLYVVVNLILQTYYGLRLTSVFMLDRLATIIGGLFFLNAPILINRLFGHYSLTSQWLIVAAIYYYFRTPECGSLRRYALPFAMLSVIAAGVTPYLMIMVVFIGLAAILRTFLVPTPGANRAETIAGAPPSSGMTRRNLRTWPHFPPIAEIRLLWVALIPGAAALSLVLFGFVVLHSGPVLEGGGYTTYSMNLLSPINPLGSLFFPAFTVLPGQQYEGYDYLGAGIICLGLFCLMRRPSLLAKITKPSIVPLLLVSIILTCLALSVRITLGTAILCTLELPQFLHHAIAIFRSSGRLFWPVHYLLILAALAGATTAFRADWSRRLVLAAAFLTQFADTLPLRTAVANTARTTVGNPLKAQDWAGIRKLHKNLVVLPAWQCDQINTPGGAGAWPPLARLAAQNGLTLNSVRAARDSAASHILNCNLLPRQVAGGMLKTDTAYVLSDGLVLPAIEHQRRTHYCRRVDGLNLCTFDPHRAPMSSSLAATILPPYDLGTEFRADRPSQGIIFSGWRRGPGPAIWTIGKRAAIYIRPVLRPPAGLRLEMQFLRSVLNARHRLQRSTVTVNGQPIGTFRFAYNGDNRERSLVIPGWLVHKAQVLEIAFDLPDAVAPTEIGIEGDSLPLALCVSRIRVVAN